jgi:hypothetical protein
VGHNNGTALLELDDTMYLAGKPCETARCEDRESLNFTQCVEHFCGSEEDEARGIVIMQETKTTLLMVCGDSHEKMSFVTATLNRDCTKFATDCWRERNARTLSLSAKSMFCKRDSEIILDCFRSLWYEADVVHDWRLLRVADTQACFTRNGLSETLWFYLQNMCRRIRMLPTLLKSNSPKAKAPVDNVKTVVFNILKCKEVTVLLKNRDTLLAKKDKEGKLLYRAVTCLPAAAFTVPAKLTAFFNPKPSESTAAVAVLNDLSALQFIGRPERSVSPGEPQKKSLDCSSAPPSVMMGEHVQRWLEHLVPSAWPTDAPVPTMAWSPTCDTDSKPSLKQLPPQVASKSAKPTKKRKLYSQTALWA